MISIGCRVPITDSTSETIDQKGTIGMTGEIEEKVDIEEIEETGATILREMIETIEAKMIEMVEMTQETTEENSHRTTIDMEAAIETHQVNFCFTI